MVSAQQTPGRARSWCFTINNYTEDDKNQLLVVQESSTYLLYAYEVGEETGTPHIQGYVHYTNARTFASMKKSLTRANLRPANGTGMDNHAYIVGPYKKGKKTKPFNPDHHEFGVMPVQGRRVDLEEVYTNLRDGYKLVEIMDCNVNLQCISVAKQWLSVAEPERDWRPEVKWFYGPPGAGKTAAAKKWLGDDTYTCSRTTSKFWDGYDAHQGVLIDDFRAGWCKFVELLGITDRYGYRVEVKGGARQLLARKIAITSPYSPEEAFSGQSENIDQLLRRISEVHEFTQVASPSPLAVRYKDGIIVEDKVKDATGYCEGVYQGPVQEETPASTNQNFECQNNIGLQLTPVNALHCHHRTRPQVSEPRQRRRQIRGQTYFDESDGSYTTQETICFAQGQSLCSSGSAANESDGASLSDYDTGTQDDISREDDDAYSCEP